MRCCEMRIGAHELDVINGVYVMGILNVTPDSFSDGGKWFDAGRAIDHAREMASQGAAIIDVGGESTRPGYEKIPSDEEIRRVVPVIEAIKRELDIPISIDTYKADVAEAALDAGADMVNDIWGLKADPAMAPLIARRGVPCCLMHNREKAVYEGDFIEDMLGDLRETLALADKAGIARERIILDPGIGFGKTLEHNLTAINRLERLTELGCPVLLAASRKSVIGGTLGLPSDQRLEGTVALSAIGVMKGAAFVRVHDVRENVRAVLMAKAVLHERAGTSVPAQSAPTKS